MTPLARARAAAAHAQHAARAAWLSASISATWIARLKSARFDGASPLLASVPLAALEIVQLDLAELAELLAALAPDASPPAAPRSIALLASAPTHAPAADQAFRAGIVAQALCGASGPYLYSLARPPTCPACRAAPEGSP